MRAPRNLLAVLSAVGLVAFIGCAAGSDDDLEEGMLAAAPADDDAPSIVMPPSSQPGTDEEESEEEEEQQQEQGTDAGIDAGGGGGGGGAGGGGTGTGGGSTTPPTPTWDVILVSAEIPPTKANGKGWDTSGGLPDPFAEAKSGAKTGSTVTRSDTLTPVWNARVLSAVTRTSLEAQFLIAVFDEDLAFHDRVGTCSIAVTDDSFDGTVQKVVCPPLQSGDVTFSLSYRIQPR
jgi:hypothetical protein